MKIVIGTKGSKHYLLVVDYDANELVNYHEISNDYDIEPNVISICTSSDKYIYKDSIVYQRY